MEQVYGVGICKGGQGKSTTVSTLARVCALQGARVLVLDLAQPGTASASLRDIWPAPEQADHGNLSTALMAFRGLAPGVAPTPDEARAALVNEQLPVLLASQPSWSGGSIAVLPWDEFLGDAAAFLQSERVLSGLIESMAGEIDLVLIDYPAEGGPLLTNAIAATRQVVMPLVPETPALEGADAILRLMARAREHGHAITLGGILLTRCEPKNKRVFEIVQTILQADDIEGEPLRNKLFPFAIRTNEFFEQAFRYGEPVWERTSNPSHWAGYVLLAEWMLRRAGLDHLAEARRGPALLPPDTRIMDTSALVLDDPEVRLADFEQAHASALR